MQTDLAFPQPLVEKYRPIRIADFIGLERPKKILTAFLKRPASGAWLFLGPSGVGKSTMAMALAVELTGRTAQDTFAEVQCPKYRGHRSPMLVCPR